jgi:translation initiation factor 2 alpha subunit (eIF-2alpha)
MYFYETEVNIGNHVIFVINENCKNGYIGVLPEYDNQEAMLPFTELKNKKFKKNPASYLKQATDYCCIVEDIGKGYVYLSYKGVEKSDAKIYLRNYQYSKKLYSLCKKLAHHGDFTEEDWVRQVRHLLTNDLEKSEDKLHTYQILSDRSLDNILQLPAGYYDIIQRNHGKLFGIKPIILEKNLVVISFHFSGNEIIKNVMKQFNDNMKTSYTDEELYQNRDLYNIKILPLALPKWQIVVTSYLKEKCQEVISHIAQTIQNSDHIDIFFEQI